MCRSMIRKGTWVPNLHVFTDSLLLALFEKRVGDIGNNKVGSLSCPDSCLGEIIFLDTFDVKTFMSGDNVESCAYREAVVAGYPIPAQRVIGETTEEGEACHADSSEL